ncbi:hypothetical protein Btru_029186 [Bulinus truncatus]|nr:hypothetical protein Btru_029186 [Bulinus truncatus]
MFSRDISKTRPSQQHKRFGGRPSVDCKRVCDLFRECLRYTSGLVYITINYIKTNDSIKGKMLPAIFVILALGSTLVQGQGSTPAPACQEYNSATNAAPLVKISQDFTVDIETVSVETGRVTNMIMYYSQSQNMIRLNIFDAGKKTDLYFYFADNEILSFDYTVGRGLVYITINYIKTNDSIKGKMLPAIFVILALGSTLVQGQGSTPAPACQEYNSATNAAPMLKISQDFTVDIETVSVETGRVTNMIMYYSQSQNMIRLNIFDAGKKTDLYFYFVDNEILSFDYTVGRGTCTVLSNLNSQPDTFIVGGVKDGKSVQVPLTVLHVTGQSGFGSNEIVLNQQGMGSARGMETLVYNSCQKWQFGDQSAVLNVTHHFSFKSWQRPDSGSVPIMVEIQGSAVLHKDVVNIHHYYNYFNWRESVEPFAFETPSGIVCQGRAGDRPFPNVPSYIKFAGETIDHADGFVRYVEEIFDSDDSLVVMRMQALEDISTSGGMNHQTYIRDYVSGLSYKINDMQFCTIVNITDDTPLPFDFITSNGKVQQLSPSQFFYNDGTKFNYLGTRNVRGMSADVWIAKTTLITAPDQEVIIEWYFAPSNVRTWNDGSQYYKDGQYRIPVRFRTWYSNNTQSIDMNIYHVDYTNIMYGVINIRNCYPDKQSNYFQFVIDGGKESVMNTNLDMFKWSTVKTIATTANVRTIRIADLQVYYEQNDAIIEFELLDAPPYAGDVVSTAPTPVSLDQATWNLQTAISNGSFQINVYDPTTNKINKKNIKSSSELWQFPDKFRRWILSRFNGRTRHSYGAHRWRWWRYWSLLFDQIMCTESLIKKTNTNTL